MRITAEGLAWSVAGKRILTDVGLDVAPGETVGLIGPNGSGKSTLLRCLAGLRTPTSGSVSYDKEPIRSWSARRIARHVAFVEQAADTDSDLRVADVVGLGRTPFGDRWRGFGARDRAVVAAALARLGLTGLRERPWKALSGGERQRAHIARALAQQPYAILLDEPTNHLDVKHQLELLGLLAATDQTVLVALHDLSLAARYCDRLLLLHDGRLVADGPPADVLTPGLLAEVFEVDAVTGPDALGHFAVTYRGPVAAPPAGPLPSPSTDTPSPEPADSPTPKEI
ncbi:ABC transporter ATP-binding protein [Streptomyces flavofungini]|uniref:ABC transporter ATP-binding protein n=1 Tax=Streptomyces flavofungini TaxID=68200 RepID=A0ABS0XCI8_9ACTN|nr:ABC transporter ATP-binding protein [Streptomyces flavofungini]MBJ3810912.1 ABC transporter ATP-binding protein [Streptomyces flavofungini]GHC41454.1 ABC transporter ATP-binding protein [Streptomyces flavofungini]